MKLTESQLKNIVKEELKKVLLREFDTDWIYDYECSELEDLLNNIDQRQFDSNLERQFAISAIKDRIESCRED